MQKNDWDEIRTRAPEETSALNWRLRPLGHPILTTNFFSINASIAQMVERKTLNLVAVGSIPTGGVFSNWGNYFFQKYLIKKKVIESRNEAMAQR